MPYCPECGMEYYEGFTVCSECNRELVYEPEVVLWQPARELKERTFRHISLTQAEATSRARNILLVTFSMSVLSFLVRLLFNLQLFFDKGPLIDKTVFYFSNVSGFDPLAIWLVVALLLLLLAGKKATKFVVIPAIVIAAFFCISSLILTVLIPFQWGGMPIALEFWYAVPIPVSIVVIVLFVKISREADYE